MCKVIFEGESLSHIAYWVHNDKKIFDKIYALLKDIDRNGASKGIGKPERLKHLNAWSRRINDEHRLIYNVDNETIHVISCRGHYE